MEKNRTVNAMRNLFIGMVVQGIQVVASLVCRVVFVRTLNEAYLGISGLFSNIISVLSLAELGIGSAIIYELYAALANKNVEQIKSWMQFYKKCYTVIGFVVTAVGLVILPFVGKFVTLDNRVTENLILLYVLYLLNTTISYFFSYRENLIQAAQKAYIVDIIKATSTIVQNIAQCVILVLTKDFLLYLIIQIFFTFATNLSIYLVAGRKYPYLKDKKNRPLDAAQKDRMIANVKAILISTVSSKMINSTDNIIITAIGGIATTGLNSNYSLLSATLIGFSNKFCAALRAGIGDAVVLKSDKEKVKLHDEIHFVYFWFFCFCSISYIFLAHDVVSVFFGEKYVLDFSIPLITGLNLYVYHEFSYNESFLQGMGLFQPIKYLNAITGILNIFLSIIFGKKIGLFGVLLATFVSQALTYRTYVPYVVFKHGFHFNARHYYEKDFMYSIQYIIIFLTEYYLCNIIHGYGILQLLQKGILCLLLINLLIVLFNYRKEEFAKFIKRARAIKNRRK